MYTIDGVAKELRRGTLTVDDVLRLLDESQVYVYAPTVLDPNTATWDEREEAASSASGIFHELYRAKATPEQMTAIAAGLQKALDAGLTIQSLWPKS